MAAYAKFTIEKTELLKELLHIDKIVRNAKRKDTTLEITIIDDFIILVVPGINVKLEAKTERSAKFTINFLYFKHVINTSSLKTLNFVVDKNEVNIDKLTFVAQTAFFDNDEVLRSIDLPLNYEAGHLIRMAESRVYTPAEIAFNNLGKKQEEAFKTLQNDLDKMASIVRKYGFSRKEIEKFITSKLKNDLKP